jgi:phosphoenolpyruvate carboxykinase (ATP)
MTTNASKLISSSDSNVSRDKLFEIALKQEHGVLASNGALVVTTGARTGRSPKDRFIVRDETTEKTVAWGSVNQPLDTEHFNQLWQRVTDYLADKKTYHSFLAVGADKHYQIPVDVITDLAWHQLFCQNLFIETA